mmetsp:Transcript_107569/g.343200  ORF Transcript_107569/g.343200 Transcript_107569/m.343200 type:complete len:407 (-) Transcript_107569:1096-2316(-)
MCKRQHTGSKIGSVCSDKAFQASSRAMPLHRATHLGAGCPSTMRQRTSREMPSSATSAPSFSTLPGMLRKLTTTDGASTFMRISTFPSTAAASLREERPGMKVLLLDVAIGDMFSAMAPLMSSPHDEVAASEPLAQEASKLSANSESVPTRSSTSPGVAGKKYRRMGSFLTSNWTREPLLNDKHMFMRQGASNFRLPRRPRPRSQTFVPRSEVASGTTMSAAAPTTPMRNSALGKGGKSFSRFSPTMGHCMSKLQRAEPRRLTKGRSPRGPEKAMTRAVRRLVWSHSRGTKISASWTCTHMHTRSTAKRFIRCLFLETSKSVSKSTPVLAASRLERSLVICAAHRIPACNRPNNIGHHSTTTGLFTVKSTHNNHSPSKLSGASKSSTAAMCRIFRPVASSLGGGLL